MWQDERNSDEIVMYTSNSSLYSKNINLDVDDDGIADWTYPGVLTGTMTTSDLSSILNGSGTPAVLNFTSDSSGIVRLSNINFLYPSTDGSSSALVSSTGLEDTTINTIWAVGSDGIICLFTPSTILPFIYSLIRNFWLQ